MSAKRTPRRFEHKRGQRERQRAFVSLSGASGGGKTKSALELGTGLVSVTGGTLFGVDTENGRMLKYAPPPGQPVEPGRTYDFVHVDFRPPFDPESYLDALRHCEEVAGPAGGCVIFDSMSHEHAGPGGRLDSSQEEAERLAARSRSNNNPDAHRFSAFRPNSRGRNDLLWSGFFLSSLHVILCFRARESYEQVGSKILDRGFTPIGGQDFIFEADCSILFMPGANGVPTWRSDKTGEQTAIKLPQEYRGIIDDGRAISAEHGAKLARWLQGGGRVARPTQGSQAFNPNGAATDPKSAASPPQPPLDGAGSHPPASSSSSPGDGFPGDRIDFAGKLFDPAAPAYLDPPIAVARMETNDVTRYAKTLADLITRAPADQKRAWIDAQKEDIAALRAQVPSWVSRLETLAGESAAPARATDGGAPFSEGAQAGRAATSAGDF